MTLRTNKELVTINKTHVIVSKFIRSKPYTITKEVKPDALYSKISLILENLINLDDDTFIQFAD